MFYILGWDLELKSNTHILSPYLLSKKHMQTKAMQEKQQTLMPCLFPGIHFPGNYFPHFPMFGKHKEKWKLNSSQW